jgi:uncharacterized protein (DUF885 family)
MIISVLLSVGCGPNPQLLKYQMSVDSTIHANIEKYPGWATEIGYYENGYEFQDISPEFIYNELQSFKKELEFLRSIDTTGWDIDSQIDYIGSMAEYKYAVSSYINDPWYISRPDFYMEDCKNSILRLFYRDPDPGHERLLMALERIKRVPDFLLAATNNIEESEEPHLVNMLRIGGELIGILDITGKMLLENFPERTEEIATAIYLAIKSIREYTEVMDSTLIADKQLRTVGKTYYDSMLYNAFMIEVGSDSVLSIAESIFYRADSILKQLKPRIEVESMDSEQLYDLPPDCRNSIISNYQNEIINIKSYLESEHILYVPEDALELRIVKMPGWLEQTGINSNYYIAPAPLDSTEPGIFYLYDSLSEYSHDDSSGLFTDEIKKEILNFILPGYHYRNFMTERDKSLSRRLENTSMFDGWNIYMEELLINREFWGDNYNIIYDFYKQLRQVALAAILEIELQANGITIDSAYSFLLYKLGEDASSYSRENIYSVTIYYAHNTSVLMGYHLFKDMQEKARAREGDKFDLREFHDKVLSEGRIPPSLIAKKYGWE